MGTQEHVYDMQAGAHGRSRSTQEPFVLICPQPPGACCGGGGDSTHFIPCRYVSSVRRNRPHAWVRIWESGGWARVWISLDSLASKAHGL